MNGFAGTELTPPTPLPLLLNERITSLLAWLHKPIFSQDWHCTTWPFSCSSNAPGMEILVGDVTETVQENFEDWFLCMYRKFENRQAVDPWLDVLGYFAGRKKRRAARDADTPDTGSPDHAEDRHDNTGAVVQYQPSAPFDFDHMIASLASQPEMPAAAQSYNTDANLHSAFDNMNLQNGHASHISEPVDYQPAGYAPMPGYRSMPPIPQLNPLVRHLISLGHTQHMQLARPTTQQIELYIPLNWKFLFPNDGNVCITRYWVYTGCLCLVWEHVEFLKRDRGAHYLDRTCESGFELSG